MKPPFSTRAAIVALAVVALAAPAAAQDSRKSAEETYRDIQATLGIVPSFFRAFPEAGIAGAWAEMKNVQMSGSTALSPKTKELIGLAVAAQVPCAYCTYFHTKVAKAHGASDEEIKEAVAMASIVRHWSTVLNGTQTDSATFQQEVDTVLRLAAEKAAAKK